MKKQVMWISSRFNNFYYDENREAVNLWLNGIDSRLLLIQEKDVKTGMEVYDGKMVPYVIKDVFCKLYNNVSNNSYITNYVEASTIEFLKEKYKEIKCMEDKIGYYYSKDKNKSKDYDVNEIMSIIENPKEYVYFLKADLFKDDKELLTNYCYYGKTLSMELYHYITNVLKVPCVLFSDAYYDDTFYWVRNYKLNYPDEKNKMIEIVEEPKIAYKECQSKIVNSESERKLLDLFKKAYDKLLSGKPYEEEFNYEELINSLTDNVMKLSELYRENPETAMQVVNSALLRSNIIDSKRELVSPYNNDLKFSDAFKSAGIIAKK